MLTCSIAQLNMPASAFHAIDQTWFQQHDGGGGTCREEAESGVNLEFQPSIEGKWRRDNLKVMRREDKLPKTSVSIFAEMLNSGNIYLGSVKDQEIQVVPYDGKVLWLPNKT